MTKKLILIPKRDSVLICLPQEWVGKPLVCTLTSMAQEDEEMVSQVSEAAIQYQAAHFRRHRNDRRARKKRLRRYY